MIFANDPIRFLAFDFMEAVDTLNPGQERGERCLEEL